MIWTAITQLLLNIFLFFINLLPAMSVQDLEAATTIINVGQTARNSVAWVNFFFPVDTLFLVLYLTVSLHATILLINIWRYVLNAVTPVKGL